MAAAKERKRLRALGKLRFKTMLEKDGADINRFEMYKKGLEMKKRGIPNSFNSFRDIIENPEYYFGFVPEVENGERYK